MVSLFWLKHILGTHTEAKIRLLGIGEPLIMDSARKQTPLWKNELQDSQYKCYSYMYRNSTASILFCLTATVLIIECEVKASSPMNSFWYCYGQ